MDTQVIDESKHSLGVVTNTPIPDVTVTLETGWPKSQAIASTTIDGKLIAQIGIGYSSKVGTLQAGIDAKNQALARLRVAIQLYNQQQLKPKEA